MIRILRALENKCLDGMGRVMPGCAAIVRRRIRIVRYIVSGGTAAAVDLGLLFIFTELMRLHYLLSSTLAFLVAFVVSFSLQKLWTFEDAGTERVHAQAAVYFVITGTNVLVNLGLMYILVDLVHLWYLLAQIITGAFIACYSFLLYRAFVFNRSHKETYEAIGDHSEGR